MVYLPTGSSASSYLPRASEAPSRRSRVEFSTAVMWACGTSLPEGSVTVPVRALRSTCAMTGIAEQRTTIAVMANTDGESNEREFRISASKGVSLGFQNMPTWLRFHEHNQILLIIAVVVFLGGFDKWSRH